jgi:hypothetical protein
MEDIDIFYGRLVYLTAFWYFLWPCGIFFPALVFCTKKNLAILLGQVPKGGTPSECRSSDWRSSQYRKSTSIDDLIYICNLFMAAPIGTECRPQVRG